jgi:hypothetical protein
MRFLVSVSRTEVLAVSHTIEVEIERNYGAFLDMLADLLPTDHGRYALMHDMRLEGVFDSPGEAERAGFAKFGRNPYSIQFVTDEPVDMGFMSNAMYHGQNRR